MRMGMKRRKTLEETTAGAAGFAGAKRFACAASCAAVLLSGCNVGPKYVKPAAPAPAPEFKESSPAAYSNPPEGTTPDKTWQPAQPQDAALKGKWWEVFNEPELNALEEQLDINNQNIAVYFQNFMAARAQVREVKSQFYPTLGTTPSYTRVGDPGGAARVSGYCRSRALRRTTSRCRSTCRGSRTCGARCATRCARHSMPRR